MKNSVRMALSLAILGWVSISSQTVQGQIPFSEDFTNATYNPNWIWHNSYSGSSNLLTGTALRIVASWQNGGSDLYWGSNSNAPCLFQPVNPHLDWIAETKIGISATNNAQGAAFVLANGSSNESPFSAIRVADQMCDGNGNNVRFNWDQYTQVYTNTNVYFRVQKSHTNYIS